VIDDALKIFANGYPTADLELERHHITRWYEDPFSMGAYSYRGPDSIISVEHGVNDTL
jgi:hypothetical protein